MATYCQERHEASSDLSRERAVPLMQLKVMSNLYHGKDPNISREQRGVDPAEPWLWLSTRFQRAHPAARHSIVEAMHPLHYDEDQQPTTASLLAICHKSRQR